MDSWHRPAIRLRRSTGDCDRIWSAWGRENERIGSNSFKLGEVGLDSGRTITQLGCYGEKILPYQPDKSAVSSNTPPRLTRSSRRRASHLYRRSRFAMMSMEAA